MRMLLFGFLIVSCESQLKVKTKDALPSSQESQGANTLDKTLILESEDESVPVGSSIPVTIKILDSNGQVDTSKNLIAAVTVSGHATCDELVEITQGVGIVKVSNNVVETVTLTLTDPGNAGVLFSGTLSLSFNPGPTDHFALITPESVRAGQPATIRIEAQDAFNNITTNYQNDVTLLTSGQVKGAGDVDLVDGSGTIVITDDRAEISQLTLTDKSQSGIRLPSATPVRFTASKFFIVKPSDALIGSSPVINIQALDETGQIDSLFEDDVSLIANGHASGAGKVDIVHGSGSIVLNDQIIELVQLSLMDTENTGLATNSSQDILFHGWKQLSRDQYIGYVNGESYSTFYTGTKICSTTGSKGFCYERSTGKWSPIGNTGGGAMPRLIQNRSGVWTGSLFCIWGRDYQTNAATGGCYDPTNDRWTTMSNTGGGTIPDPRDYATGVWTGTQYCLWGGLKSSPYATVNTGGCYDPATDRWTTISNTGGGTIPGDRTYHRAVWTGQKMCVWGGNPWVGAIYNDGGCYNPTNDSWSPISNTGGGTIAEARRTFVSVWTGTEMCVWGGYGSVYLATGGCYNPSTDAWRTISNTGGGVVPEARGYVDGVWTGTQMCVWGGMTQNASWIPTKTGGCYNPSNDSWQTISNTGGGVIPHERWNHMVIWAASKMWIFGGIDVADFFDTAGASYDPATDSWTPNSPLVIPNTTPDPLIPTPRSSPSSFLAGSKFCIWGGTDADNAGINTGGCFDLNTSTWTQISNSGGGTIPSIRSGYTSLWTGSRFCIWGGREKLYRNQGGTYVQTGSCYDPILDKWTVISNTGGGTIPNARYDAKAVAYNNRMCLWGGYESGSVLVNTGGCYDPATDQWTSISNTGGGTIPVVRADYIMEVVSGRLCLWGGRDASWALLTSGGCYNPTNDSWTAIGNAGGGIVLSARRYASAIASGTELCIWGGKDGSWTNLVDGACYNPSLDRWKPMGNSGGGPLFTGGGYNIPAVLVGNQICYYGGYDGAGNMVAQGACYDPVFDKWTSLPGMTLNLGPAELGNPSMVYWNQNICLWGGYLKNFSYTQNGWCYRMPR